MASSLATCLARDSVAVSLSESEKERESDADFGEGRSCGFFAFHPVVAARALPVKQAPSQFHLQNPKKSALTFCRCGVVEEFKITKNYVTRIYSFEPNSEM